MVTQKFQISSFSWKITRQQWTRVPRTKPTSWDPLESVLSNSRSPSLLVAWLIFHYKQQFAIPRLTPMTFESGIFTVGLLEKSWLSLSVFLPKMRQCCIFQQPSINFRKGKQCMPHVEWNKNADETELVLRAQDEKASCRLHSCLWSHSALANLCNGLKWRFPEESKVELKGHPTTISLIIVGQKGMPTPA